MRAITIMPLPVVLHLGNRKMILRQEIPLAEQRLVEAHPHEGALISRADFTFVMMDTAKGCAIPLEGRLADIPSPLRMNLECQPDSEA